jgi:hypothetical protein
VAARPCLNLSSAELLVRIRAEYLEAAGIHTREGRRARASPNRPWRNPKSGPRVWAGRIYFPDLKTKSQSGEDTPKLRSGTP